MVSKFKSPCILLAAVSLFLASSILHAQEETTTAAKVDSAEISKEKKQAIQDQISKFTRRQTKSQTYLLKYKMKKGETIHWKHDHRILNKSRHAGSSEKTSTRTQPEYSWKVKNVDSRGNMRFEISLDRIQVFSNIGETSETHYDSETSKEIPDSCRVYAERVGRPSATYTISPTGQVVASKSNYLANDLGGIGDAPVIAFSDKPIAVGHKWAVEDTLQARDEYGVMKQVNIRVQYTLEKVIDGKAYIAFKTDILTPLSSERVRSQILTHLIKGIAVFDINRGTFVKREFRWDEKVQGYNTPDSFLHYQAQREEVRVFPKEIAKTTQTKPIAKVAKKETTSSSPNKTSNLLQPMKSKK